MTNFATKCILESSQVHTSENHLMKVTMLEMRRDPGKIVEAIERNEKVILTKRGKEIAEIVPMTQKERPSIRDNPAIGMWKDREDMKDPSEWVRKIRKPRYSDL